MVRIPIYLVPHPMLFSNHNHESFEWRTTIALFPAMLIMVNLSAQIVPLRFESLNINQGLSQGYISGIAQDKEGFMWFSTGDGLNKYDGYSFTIYHHDIQDTASIGSDDLTCVFQDSKDRIWIGTRNNGLDLFDKIKNEFIHFRNIGTGSIRSNTVLGIKEDKAGILWIRTNKGIDRLEITDHNTPARKKYNFTSIQLDSISQKPTEGAEAIFIDSRNRIFITTHKSILELLPYSSGSGYKLIERFHFYPGSETFIPELLEDTLNHCLLLNNTNIIKFPDYNFSYPQYLHRTPGGDIRWTIDHKNTLWVSDQNNITQLDLNSGEKRTVFPADPLQQKVLNAPTVYFTDKTGIVWLGSGGYGLLRFDSEVDRFHHILPGKNIYQIKEYAPGKIITNDFISIDLSKVPALVDTGFANKLRRHEMLSGKSIQSFGVDTAGNFWCGTTGAIINFNPVTKTIQTINIPFKDLVALPFPVYADRKENVWMGYKKFVVRYNIKSGQFFRYEYPIQQSSYDYDFLQCIFDDDGLIWIGTTNGLFCFDTEASEMKPPFFFRQSDSTSVSNNHILSFCQDQENPSRFLWVGTKGGGLNRLDKSTGTFKHFTTKDGLSNNVVYGIETDYAYNLWLSTNKGISVFNVKHGSFRKFDVNDGLQDNEFNRYASTRTTQGHLVYGGLNGINYFDPGSMAPLESPAVAITELRLFNRPVRTGVKGSPLTKDIGITETLELRHEQNVITFRFAAMDYRRHNNIRYRYMMEGFDEDWIYSGAINEATYTNLDAGEYNFRVQATFDETNWMSQTTELNISINAPWWKSWWFKILVIAGSIVLAYALYRYRIHQLIMLDSLRNRIARDLHDEVGSSISTIAIYSKIMHEQMENKTFNNEPLVKKITDHATEIMESMNDIIWNINTKNDAFENIINRMREQAVHLLEAKGYNLHFNFDESLYQMQLPMEKRRDFYLIYKEAINNIAKYADGQNVWIILSIQPSSVRLTIKDDGKGFDGNLIKKSGNGLTNMQQRAVMLSGKCTISSEPGKGTTVHLEF